MSCDQQVTSQDICLVLSHTHRTSEIFFFFFTGRISPLSIKETMRHVPIKWAMQFCHFYLEACHKPFVPRISHLGYPELKQWLLTSLPTSILCPSSSPTSSRPPEWHSRAGTGKLQLAGKSSPLPVYVFQVLLEQSDTRSFMSVYGCFGHSVGRAE